ncbi:MAG: GTP-binding protein [Coriobacteriales bacterium]|jgi:G3E family GTPase
MKVFIVSGFLGAGKTTFIKRLVAALPERNFAIFENEFGETDIDARVLKQESSQMQVWELSENCVCCTGKADFLTNLVTISASVNPDVLIVEPTGVARLGTLIENIENLEYEQIRMLRPVTMVDARAFFSQKDAYDDIYLDQVRSSSTIILSKSEDLTEDDVKPYVHELSELNSSAEIVWGDYQEHDTRWWEAFLETFATDEGRAHDQAQEHTHDHDHDCNLDRDHQDDLECDHSHNHHVDEMVTFSLHGVELPTPVHLLMILELTAMGAFGDVPRAKGCLSCGTPGEWIRFDLVDKQWVVSGFPPQTEAQVTFIGSEIHTEDIERYFSVLDNQGTCASGSMDRTSPGDLVGRITA